MRALAVLVAGCFGIASAADAVVLLPKHPRVVRHRTRVGDWRLDVARNPFSGDIVCRLRDAHGQAIYRQGAVGFRFRRSWDVAAAVYRLDGGEPRAWRDDLPELVRLGTPMDTGGIDNPTEGRVWIPLSRLSGVNAVAIQPRLDRAQRVFHLRGFRGLYELAQARGCVPDVRFVR
jgi:hypothetical protein